MLVMLLYLLQKYRIPKQVDLREENIQQLLVISFGERIQAATGDVS